MNNPFNPIRFSGSDHAEDLNRVEDRIRQAIGDLINRMAATFMTRPPGGGSGGAPINARYWISTAEPALPFAVNMALLGDGILMQTVTSAVSTPDIVTIGAGLSFVGGTLSATGGTGTVTTVTGTSPIFITSTPTTTPNVTIQGSIVSGSTSTTAQNIGLLATGILKGTVSAGVSTISPAVAGTDFQAPITWPAAELILYSAGTATPPSGYAGFAFDVTGLAVSLNTSTPLHIYNLGDRNSDADYERLLITNTANIYLIKSEKNGTGTVRNIKIDADTALLRLNALDVQLDPGTTQTWNNATGTNYERVRAQWIGSAFTLTSEAGGSGVVQPISINADTASIGINADAGFTIASTSVTMQSETGGTGHNLVIVGNNGDGQFESSLWDSISLASTHGSGIVIDGGFTLSSTSVTIVGETGGTGHNLAITGNAGDGQLIVTDFDSFIALTTHNSSVSADYLAPGVRLTASPTVTSAAGAVNDAIFLTTTATISGTTTISTATGFNGVTIARPGYAKAAAGALTITYAATLYIEREPNPGTDITITNPYAIWIDGGVSRFDGNGSHVFELPADATGNVTLATGRIPVIIGGATKYLRYFDD